MTIHYQEHGDMSAPLMVFLHGGGVSSWMWDRQMKYFNHYHCVIPDLPGHGRSRNIPFSIGRSAEEIIRLIEEKGKDKKVILIGFSLGSQVIIQLLSESSHLVDFSIINSALVRPITYGKSLIRPTIRFSYPFIKQRWFSKLQAKTLFVDEEQFEKYYEESNQMTCEGLVKIMEENMSFQLPKDFSLANGKILVTVGEKEKSIMKKSAKDIVDANPNCTGITIPDIGHGVSLAMPDYFNTMVETWILAGNLPSDSLVIERR